MPVDLDKIRALLASVAGFTEGPWHGDDLGRVVTVRAATPVCDYTPRANRPIIAAAPDLHRELTEAVGEIEIRACDPALILSRMVASPIVTA